MVHIFLIFGCLFCYDHVLSLNLNFGFFMMPSLEKVILYKNLSVLSKNSDGILLQLLITMHCLEKTG